MATIKSYTSLWQSKKLAEILPLESADMYWLNKHTDLTETKYEVFVIDKSNKHIDFFNSYAVAIDNNEIIPCWSLAALLNVLPPIEGFRPIIDLDINLIRYEGNYRDELCFNGDNLIDVCVEMINKLHELNLL